MHIVTFHENPTYLDTKSRNHRFPLRTRDLSAPPGGPGIERLQVPLNETVHFVNVTLSRLFIVRRRTLGRFFFSLLHPRYCLEKRLALGTEVDFVEVLAQKLAGVSQKIDREVFVRNHERRWIVRIHFQQGILGEHVLELLAAYAGVGEGPPESLEPSVAWTAD